MLKQADIERIAKEVLDIHGDLSDGIKNLSWGKLYEIVFHCIVESARAFFDDKDEHIKKIQRDYLDLLHILAACIESCGGSVHIPYDRLKFRDKDKPPKLDWYNNPQEMEEVICAGGKLT